MYTVFVVVMLGLRRAMYEECSESKERLCIQPVQLFH